MKPEIRIFFEIVGIWLVCILPGIGLGRFLAKQGIGRDRSALFSLTTLWLVLVVRMAAKTSDTWWSEMWGLYIFMTIGAFLVTYRYEYGNTWHWGRWWWLRKAEIAGGKAKPLNPWVKGYLTVVTILSIIASIVAFIWTIVTIFR